MGSKFRLALVQMAVELSKSENVSRATRFIRQAAEKGANMVALPEYFVSPCSPSLLRKSAEPVPGETTLILQEAAKKNNVYLLGGTIVEQDGDQMYNSCIVFNPDGDIIAKYRKMHMFDVDLPPDLNIVESEITASGNNLVTFDTPICRVGLGICYDIRFPEVSLIYEQKGCKLLFLAGSFNITTGPVHWETILRTRAFDHQLYVAAASPPPNPKSPYQTWGHSMIVNPWGDILTQAGSEEELIMAEIAICRVGLGICYDIRFPEVSLIYEQKGCKLLFLAGSFNITTGPVHWETILRTRAFDHQLYVAAASPPPNPKSPYQTWGHSMIVNPWGDILTQAGSEEELIMAEIDMDVLEKFRRQMPLSQHRRKDVYRTEYLQTDN